MNKITAVILAAGASSRFYPFNDLHKSMAKILGKPILEHTIDALKREGITQIVLVTGENSAIKDYFGDGKKFGVSIDYVVQREALGAGNALLLAEKKVKGDFLLLNAHRVDADKFVSSLLKKKLENNAKAVLLFKQEENTQIYGVLRFEKDRVVDVVEKPKKGEGPSNLRIVGIYFLPYDFFKILNDIPSEHYQLEKAISAYAKENFVSFIQTKDKLVTLRYPWHLLGMKNYLLKKVKRMISKDAQVAKSAEIIGEVIVEDGVKIMEGVRIKGPCYVGKNVMVGNNALLRNGVDVEEGCVIGAYMEMKNTILMKNSTTHSGFIGDSVVGENCRIAAQICTGNVRLDRNVIKTVVKGEEIETGIKYLGALIGSGSNIGIKVSTMPGVIIGRNVTIGPSTVVMKNVPDNTKYYTKFQEIVSKKNVLRQAQDLQKPIVLFDLDYTMFDVRHFDKNFHAYLAEKFGLEEKLVEESSFKIIRELVHAEHFLDVDKYLKLLLSQFGKEADAKEIEKFLFGKEFFKAGFYPDVEITMRTLKDMVRLGIFSQGDEKLQGAKLSQSGLRRFFEEELIYFKKPKKLDFLPSLKKIHGNDKVYLVEDKLTVLAEAKKQLPSIFTIWIKRGWFAEHQKEIPGFEPDATIKDLSEVVELIIHN